MQPQHARSSEDKVGALWTKGQHGPGTSTIEGTVLVCRATDMATAVAERKQGHRVPPVATFGKPTAYSDCQNIFGLVNGDKQFGEAPLGQSTR